MQSTLCYRCHLVQTYGVQLSTNQDRPERRWSRSGTVVKHPQSLCSKEVIFILFSISYFCFSCFSFFLFHCSMWNKAPIEKESEWISHICILSAIKKSVFQSGPLFFFNTAGRCLTSVFLHKDSRFPTTMASQQPAWILDSLFLFWFFLSLAISSITVSL